MAKIHEEVVVLKLSKLVRDGDDAGSLVNTDLVEALQTVAQELVGTAVIVEIESGA